MLDIRFLFYTFITFIIGVSPIFYYIYNGTLYFYQCDFIFIFNTIYILTSLNYKSKIKLFKNKDNHKKINYSTYESFARILLVMSFIANMYYFYKNKTFLFSGNMENGRINALSGNGIILQIMNLSNIGLGILFELYLEKKYSIKKFAFLCLFFIPFMLLRGFRSSVLGLFIIFILMYNKKYTIKPKKIIKFGIIIILLIGILSTLRSDLSGGSISIVNSLIITLKNGSINLDYIFKKFGSSVPFQYVYSYLINIKMLAPGPDNDFTLWLKDIMKISFNGGGVTPTIIGELFLNFGYIGVYIGAVIIGIIVSKINNNYVNSKYVYFSSFLGYECAAAVGGGFANVELSLLFTSIVYFFIVSLCLKKME